MTTARDLMTRGVECAAEDETLVFVARKMRDLDIGALPICGADDKLRGMLTDRDIVVKILAEGKDPRTVTAGELAQGRPLTVDAGESAEEVLHRMAEHQVRRIPVIDNGRLVGIISQADIARQAPNAATGAVVHDVSRGGEQ